MFIGCLFFFINPGPLAGGPPAIRRNDKMSGAGRGGAEDEDGDEATRCSQD